MERNLENMMKKQGKKRTVVYMISMMFFCFFLMRGTIYASSASIVITTADTQVKQGDKFTVVVIAESAAVIGNFETYLSYDADLLEFDIGGSYVSGGDGTIHILEAGSGNDAAVKKYAIQFYAKKNGSCEISVSDRPTVLEADTGEEMSVSKNSLSVTIGAEEKKLNNNRNLSSLSISNGSLEPEFSSKQTEYNVTVGSEVNTLFVIAKPDNKKSTVTVTGNENLKTGQNAINIAVKSQAGEIKNYIVRVKKMSLEEELLNQEEKAEETEKAEEIKEEVKIFMEDGKTYLENTNKYEMVTLEDAEALPSGYMETSIVIGGQKVTAYTLESDLENDFLLMYLKHEGEEAQFYQYDRKEHTLQRYKTDITKVINENSLNSQTTTSEEYSKNLFQLTIVIAIETAMCALLLAVVIRLYLKSGKKQREDDFDI